MPFKIFYGDRLDELEKELNKFETDMLVDDRGMPMMNINTMQLVQTRAGHWAIIIYYG